MKIALLNGPNLNLLGLREPGIYGSETLQDVENLLRRKIHDSGADLELVCYQSNSEGALIDFIQQSRNNGIEYIIFNPGAYTHTSIALHDAIAGVQAKVIEVHISNIHKREEYRRNSYISSVAVGQIVGFGIAGYVMALDYILNVGLGNGR
ncbi:MAG: type II 3-dehydroquinate dehydratase [Spirochaetales bacterium]|nr:type II 3-dehydroquinate dehydratase [Spirochaetales bacterium]